MGQALARVLQPVGCLSHGARCLMTTQSCGAHAADAELTPRGNKMPPVVHATLSKEQIGRGRVIVIGDIHGCNSELADLLQKCQYQQGVDTFVSVGDLVGKGPNSVEVVQDVRRLGGITVRGNWDENALAAYRKWRSGNGLEDKWRWLERLSQRDVQYLAETPFSLSIPSHGVIVVHAGLVPGGPLEEQKLYDLIEVRHVDIVDPGNEQLLQAKKYRALPKFPREAGHPWATIWPGPEHVIFGHHARRRLQKESFASGIDTGCCLGEDLTALILPSLADLYSRSWQPSSEGVTRESMGAELVSVKARQAYRVDDKD